MAVVPVVTKTAVGAVVVSPILLSTSGDTLVYTKNRNQDLWLFNTGNSDVTVTIDGEGGTTMVVPGTAGTTISIASGLAINVPANLFAYLALDKAEAFLQGTVAITASTGAVIKAVIVSPY